MSEALTGYIKTLKADRPKRLQSLDALRGFDMFWIISGEGIFHGMADAVMANHALTRNPENWQIGIKADLAWWEKILVQISNQLHHSPWNGFAFYDLIFPLFIFIAGVSMPYSIGNKLDNAGIIKSVTKKEIYRSLIKRTILLILFGMIVNGALQFKGYETTRFASVLGRIGLSCFFAAIIYLNASFRARIFWCAGILIGYWLLMSFVPVPGFGAGVLTQEGNLAAYIDRLLLPGKLHRTVYDPEGLLSTIPAIVTALLGIFAGEFLKAKQNNFSANKKAGILATSAMLLLLAGKLFGYIFPINKIMWTSSFVLYTGGWSLLLLSLFYFIIDVQQIKKWSQPLVWIGMNSILIYITAHGLVNFQYSSEFLFGGFIKYVPAAWQSALIWTGVLILQLALLYYCHKKRIFLKL